MAEQTVSGIPTMVDVSFDAGISEPRKRDFEYGAATPGTIATTAASVDLSSPFGLFVSFAALRAFETKDDDEEPEQKVETEHLGITRPSYGPQHDEESTGSNDRIGIETADYSVPEGDLPLSPIDPFFKMKKKKPAVSKKNDSVDEDEFWRLGLGQQQRHDPDTCMAPQPDLPVVPEDGVDRFIHQQTAEGHYLVNSRPLVPLMSRMKYSLTEGNDAMPLLMRQASDPKLFTPKTRPNIVFTHGAPSVTGSPTDGASFKVFMFLIQPKSKIFEIIQLFYAPSETLVGDLLDMIPANATEPALGMQEYIGLCRPKGNGDRIDLDMLASGSNGRTECAKIIRGEILVAIPTGCSGPMCAKLAQPLLTNPKVQKLLMRSDPLAPGKKKHRSSSRRYKSITVDGVNEGANPYSPNKKENGRDKEHDLLRKAFQPQDDTFVPQEVRIVPLDVWKTQMSLRSDSSCSSFASVNSVECTSPRSPRRTSSHHRNTCEIHSSIAENPREETADSKPSSLQQLSDNISPSSTHSSGGDLAALEAKLNDNDLNGAIEAFGKMLSGRATDKKILEQLYQTLQTRELSD
jgi:hypothetical protein